MRYSVLGISLALVWFMLVNLAVSIMVGAFAGVRSAGRPGRPRPRSATTWLLLRVSPSLAAACFVAFVYAPAFARFEPREAAEPLGPGLGAMVGGALLVIGWAWWRGVAAWRRVRDSQCAWLQNARRIEWPKAPVPVFQVDVASPIVSLVGIRRQRLFISRQVVEALTPDELDVVVAHEFAHRSAWDNLRRLLLLVSPDLVSLTRMGSTIETAWANAAEDAADRRATSGDRWRAVALSAALVKVARLSLVTPRLAGPVSSLDDGGPIAERVHRLAIVDPRLIAPPQPRRLLLGVAVALLGACLALPEAALLSVHRVTEFLVRLAS
jgi:hypothetical protein